MPKPATQIQKHLARNQAGKVFVKFLIWPSIILSILLTLLLNIIL